MRALFFLLSGLAAFAADGNRLAYLDDDSPFWPTAKSPKFITPQWIGEPGVDAVVILAIDDMRDTAKYEAFLRPILDRLKKIDGRAPVSIMTNTITPEDPQLAAWLKEGVSLEVHTLTHPCPCLGKATFDEAKRVYHGGVDLLASVPGNRPVAFRMPCCDSMNSASPRFFAEIFNKASGPGGLTGNWGHFLTADSSVFVRPSGEAGVRFAKYFPAELKPPTKVSLADYAGFIEDYPYPYVIGKMCWEFPCMTPSDWQASNAIGPKTPEMLDDWKAALDWTVSKQGVMTTVFHPHGWSAPEQWVAFIDYAQEKFGKRVKFLTFREAVGRLEKNALNAYWLRHPLTGDELGVRLLDVDADGFMDVMIGNNQRTVTRLWHPKEARWSETETPAPFQAIFVDGPLVDYHVRFGMVRDATAMLSYGAWEFTGGKWKPAPELLAGLPDGFSTEKDGKDAGARLRDFDGDGHCELLLNHDIYEFDRTAKKWRPAGYRLSDGCAVVDSTGHDNGLRFVDLNGDGYDDVFQSNDRGHAIHLWAGHVRADLGWTRGWPHKVSVSSEAPSSLVIESIAPFVKAGQNNGGWFHRGHVVWQNEETVKLEAYTLRRSFKDLIAVQVPPQKTPAESQKCFVPRPGFTVELVAAEPLVESPVAFEWDAHGRLWVVEMRDYPSGMDGKGEPGGRIKILTDEDGDGRYDKATLFAEGLRFPTGLHPWRDGVIVADAPDIAFYRATDGDDESDERTVLFTGFTPGNQQHRMNGFEWGLDGWLYGANGDSGGRIVAADVNPQADLPSGKGVRALTSAATNISGRDFRFLPDGSAFEAESGQTQYGRRRDDWGNWFGNNNPTWLWHYTIEDRYLRRNPKLAVKSVRRVTSDDTRVFPAYALADAPTRLNQPQTLGHATSANSPTPYRDELFGPDFATSVFISEPVYNVVHREVLVPDGATFSSRRADVEREREFLASTDLWFRPTMLKTGPDGALYIADMHRFVLEHPEWIAPETQSRMDLRAGADKGRIWRIFPTGAKLRPVPNLAKLDNTALATALDSQSGWQRDTVQRLLIENGHRASPEAAPKLRELLRGAKNPKVRVQAIATLATLNAFTPDDLRATLRDAHPQVRVQALRGAEKLTQSAPVVPDRAAGEIFNTLLACENDPEFIVRRQLALTLGDFRAREAAKPAGADAGAPLAALTRLAEREGDNAQMRVAIMSSLKPDDALFKRLNSAPAAIAKIPELPKPTTPDRAKVIASYASVPKLKGDAARGQQFFKAQCALCHRFKGEGVEVGPDLAMTATKPDDWMLTALFDPNAAVEPRYAAQLVKLKAGGELTGIIASETANNITLRLPGGAEQAVLRDDFTALHPLGKSLMPEGLESALKPQDVADLLAWLRAK